MIDYLKGLENAWKRGFITLTEYHSLLDHFVFSLWLDETR